MFNATGVLAPFDFEVLLWLSFFSPPPAEFPAPISDNEILLCFSIDVGLLSKAYVIILLHAMLAMLPQALGFETVPAARVSTRCLGYIPIATKYGHGAVVRCEAGHISIPVYTIVTRPLYDNRGAYPTPRAVKTHTRRCRQRLSSP